LATVVPDGVAGLHVIALSERGHCTDPVASPVFLARNHGWRPARVNLPRRKFGKYCGTM